MAAICVNYICPDHENENASAIPPRKADKKTAYPLTDGGPDVPVLWHSAGKQ